MAWSNVNKMFSKVDCKILVSIGLIQNFENLDLAMAKVKKVNISVTYSQIEEV